MQLEYESVNWVKTDLLQKTYPQTSPYLLHISLKSNSSVCEEDKAKLTIEFLYN